MKKKNLLALSALVLSLGLTVSSCAGQPGEKGDDGEKGDTGETGPQGPQGQAGQDGKSFVDIIVRDWNVTGGEINQDKYFVEMGKKESVTFTFTPDSEDAEVVVNIEINGEVVNPVLELVPGEDGKVTWSYEVPDNMGGLQLTAATFTTVDDYALDQLYVYYSTLSANDNQLAAFENEDGTWTADADQVKGEWFNSDVVKTVTSEAGKIATEVAKLTTAENPNPTATEKLAKVNELLPTAEEAVKAAYDKAVTEVKEAAIEAIEDLSDEVSSDNYKDADRKAILDEGKAAINAATSIEDVTTLVNKVEVEDKLELGTYNELYSRKNAAFDKIEQALEDAYELVPELEDTEDPDYEELKTALSTWKIDLDTVTPKATADEYLTKVSAAKSLEEIPVYTEDSATDAEVSYKKGDVVLAVEGADAVAGSVEYLKDTLVANIRASYEKEVDDSKAISTSSAKESLKGVINNSIDTWLTVNEDSSLLLYTESTLAYEDEDNKVVTVAGSGLVGYIENVIGTKGNANYNAAFQAERLQNALAGAKTELAAAIKAVKDADSDYSKAISYSKVTSGDHKDKYLVNNPKIGVKDYEIANPFVSEATEATDKKFYADTLTKGTDVGGVTGNETYSVDDYYTSLFPADGSLPAELEGAADQANPVLVVKEFIADQKENIKNIYTDAVEFYMGKQQDELKLTEGKTEDDILLTEWNKLFSDPMKADETYTMSDVSSARKGMETAKTLLFDATDGLYTNVEALLDAKAAEGQDADWVNQVYVRSDETGATSISDLRKQYETLKENVILGKADESDVEDFVKDLTDLYEVDVASYKEDAVAKLREDVQNRKSSSDGKLSVAQVKLMENRLTEAEAILGTDKVTSAGTTYKGDTVTSINDWFADAETYVIPDNDGEFSPSGDLGQSATEEWFDLLSRRAAQLRAVGSEVLKAGHDTNGVIQKLVGGTVSGDSYKAEGFGYWNTIPVESEKVTLTIGFRDELVYNYPGLIETLGLKGELNDEKHLVYEIDSVADVNTWYEDASKVLNFAISTNNEIWNLAKDYRDAFTAQLDSLVGKTLAKDATADDVKTQLNIQIGAMFAAFGKTNVTDFIDSVTFKTDTTTVESITIKDDYLTTGGIIKLGNFTAMSYDFNNAESDYADDNDDLIHILTVCTGKHSDSTLKTYDLTTSSGRSALLTAVKAEIAKVTGTTTSGNN